MFFELSDLIHFLEIQMRVFSFGILQESFLLRKTHQHPRWREISKLCDDWMFDRFQKVHSSTIGVDRLSTKLDGSI